MTTTGNTSAEVLSVTRIESRHTASWARIVAGRPGFLTRPGVPTWRVIVLLVFLTV